MSNNDGDLGSFLAGFVVGGLIGAGVALLFAPQSGEATRVQIRDRSLELRDRADEEIQELRRRSEEQFGELRAQAADYQQKAHKSLEDARTKLAETGEQLAQRAKQVADGSKSEPTESAG